MMKALISFVFIFFLFPLLLPAAPDCKNIIYKIHTAKSFSSSAGDTIFLADPTIFLDKGVYYLYGTNGDQGFLVYQSSDLKTWDGPFGKVDGYALKKGDSFGDKGFWAPQVFKRGKVYYMAYTANEQIAIARSNSPLGPFKQDLIKPVSGSGLQIDPFVFFDSDGTPYMYHVKLKEGNRIFVSEMKPDLTDVILGTEVECIASAEPWENTENTTWPVAEGPAVIKYNRLYYLIYSANDFRNKDYAVGYATARSPKGPWSKYENNPFISRSMLQQNGTGHGDLFQDKKGSFKYVLHVHNSPAKVSPRITGLIDVKFSKGRDGVAVMKADESSFFLLKSTGKK